MSGISFSGLKEYISESMFLTKPLSIFINPCFIIRNGIFRLVRHHSSDIRGKILDVGCGSKPYETLFSNCQSYIGVDIEDSGHDHVNSKVDFFYDGKLLPFDDSCFDAVVCFEVFEHVFNADDFIKDIYRVLKPGGFLLISIPFAWEEHEIPYDYARYTSYGLSHIVRSNGFHILELTKTTSYVLAICQSIMSYFFLNIFPRRGYARLFSVLLIFPFNIFSYIVDFLLPTRYQYFCNCFLKAVK